MAENEEGEEKSNGRGPHSIIFLTTRLVPRDEGRTISVGPNRPFLDPGLILRLPRVIRLSAPMGITAQPPQQGVKDIGKACLGQADHRDNAWVH